MPPGNSDPHDVQQLRWKPRTTHIYAYKATQSLGTMQGIFARQWQRHRRWPGQLSVKIAVITDGTSNTFIYGEHAHSRLATLEQGDYYGANWWTSGDYGDTTFCIPPFR